VGADDALGRHGNAVTVLTRGDDLLLQSTFFPFEMVSRRRDGVALRVAVDGPTYRSALYGEVSEVDGSAILDGARLHVFATNRSLDEEAALTVAVADRGVVACVDAELLGGPGPRAANSFERPDVVRATPCDGVRVEGGRALVAMPPLSFAAMTLRLG